MNTRTQAQESHSQVEAQEETKVEEAPVHKEEPATQNTEVTNVQAAEQSRQATASSEEQANNVQEKTETLSQHESHAHIREEEPKFFNAEGLAKQRYRIVLLVIVLPLMFGLYIAQKHIIDIIKLG